MLELGVSGLLAGYEQARSWELRLCIQRRAPMIHHIVVTVKLQASSLLRGLPAAPSAGLLLGFGYLLARPYLLRHRSGRGSSTRSFEPQFSLSPVSQ